MSELLNQTIGGYHLLEVIGGGGVATVYRARPVAAAASNAPEVAVKVIYPEFARQPSIAANFAQITRAAAQLANHPHILPVLASGEERNYLYLVTPLVKEGSLATWMAKGGRLGVSDAGPFFQQLCGAVAYAHSLGLTHGNIKPNNVFLFEGRHVLLGDFGLLWDVRALDPSWSGSDVAAFEYLAPEVFDGRVTPAGDVYSLGATLYATLTGHAPFHLNKLGDLVAAARQQTPPSLAQATPPPIAAIITLDPVVRQAMAKQAEQRFATAAALGQAIEGTLRQAATNPALQGPPAAPVPSAAFGAAPPASPMPGAANAPQFDPQFPQFPQFPPMPGGADLAMGAAVGAAGAAPFAGPAAFAAPEMRRVEPGLPSAELDGPTRRVPAPLLGDIEGPTARVGAIYELPPDIPSSRLAAIAPIAPPKDDLDFNFAGPRQPGASRSASRPLPPAQTPAPALGAGAESGVFSATALELPRLTNPAMGVELPADWHALVTDESARKRHDPFAAGESALVPLPPLEEFASSHVDGAGAARYSGRAARDDARSWDAPGSAWDEPGARESWGAVAPTLERGDVSGGLRDEAEAHYDIERMVATSARISVPVHGRGRGGRAAHQDGLDTMQGQKVWTNSRQIVRGKRRPKAPFVTIVALLALTVMELAGLALVRPDVCVTHACTEVANYVRHLAPGLRLPGVTAPVYVAPSTPRVSVLVEGSGNVSFKLFNSSADPIQWSATPTLAWMSVSPSSGTLAGGKSATLMVTVTPHGVSPGVYVGALAVHVGEGSSSEPVVVTVTPGAQLALAQRALTFTTCGVSKNLTVTNSGGAKLSFTATPSDSSALQVNPGGGALAPGGSTALSIMMNCGAATGSTYAVIITSDGGSATIGVTLS